MRLVLAILLASVTVPLMAQDRDTPEPGEPFGRIFSAAVGREPGRFAIETPAQTFFASPSLADAKGAFISGVAVGTAVPMPNGWRWSLKLGYKQIEIEDADSRDKYTATAKLQFLNHAFKSRPTTPPSDGQLAPEPPQSRLKMTAILDASQVSAGRDSREFVLATDYIPALPGNKLTLTANVGFARAAPKSGDSVDDLKFGGGISYDLLSNIGFAVDYTADNDVAEEDDYSLTFYQALGEDGELVYGVGKHGVIFAAYKLNFQFR